jgi:hypothetical protein
MAHKDFIPSKESDFREWEANLLTYIEPKIGSWMIPEVRWMNLAESRELYESKYALADNPSTRTPVIVKEKNEAKETFIANIRTFLASYITSNLDVTDADRVAMALPIHSKSHVHHPITVLRPSIIVRDMNSQVVGLDFIQPNGSKAKPEFVTGIVFIYAVSDTPIEDPAALSETALQSAYFTKTAEKMHFEPEQSGKFLCGRACYTNAIAERGDLGQLVCIRIP